MVRVKKARLIVLDPPEGNRWETDRLILDTTPYDRQLDVLVERFPELSPLDEWFIFNGYWNTYEHNRDGGYLSLTPKWWLPKRYRVTWPL